MTKVRPRRETVALWQAAAWGAHRSGDHETERHYRNVARMMRGRPPITRFDRCVDGTKRDER
jgi:hypothetical protein